MAVVLEGQIEKYAVKEDNITLNLSEYVSWKNPRPIVNMKFQNTHFLRAARAGNHEKIRYYIEEKVDINTSNQVFKALIYRFQTFSFSWIKLKIYFFSKFCLYLIYHFFQEHFPWYELVH